MIPIGNLYYMLCYAWNRLDERDLVDTSAIPRQDLPNLLARILATGLKRVLRQGIYRSYINLHEDTRNPRGKINVADSLKRGLEHRGLLSCSIDELSSDVAHNRILRATVRRLASSDAVAPSLGHELRLLERQLQGISVIEVRSPDFARVQLHRNNAFYRFLLNVCEIAFHCLLAEAEPGRYRFRDFLRDEVRMRKVFQDFVYHFYRAEQRSFTVSSQRVDWDVSFVGSGARELLPDMITDVCLDSPTRKIVIECKYTPHVLQENWGKLSSRSEHLYQLFAYLKHLEAKGGPNRNCEGSCFTQRLPTPLTSCSKRKAIVFEL
jgi:5-methylcytosine-specific restriction enzyme subunit McrC